MATLDMYGPFRLNNEEVDKRVRENKIGNYAYGYIGYKKGKRTFIVRYVGRSDNDLRQEIKTRYKTDAKFTDNDCLYFKFSYAENKKEAYEKECRNYHDFGGSECLYNDIHPARPAGKQYSCPIKGCEYND